MVCTSVYVKKTCKDQKLLYTNQKPGKGQQNQKLLNTNQKSDKDQQDQKL